MSDWGVSLAKQTCFLTNPIVSRIKGVECVFAE